MSSKLSQTFSDLKLLARHLGCDIRNATRKSCITAIAEEVAKDLSPEARKAFLDNALKLDEKASEASLQVDIDTEAGRTFYIICIHLLLRNIPRPRPPRRLSPVVRAVFLFRPSVHILIVFVRWG